MRTGLSRLFPVFLAGAALTLLPAASRAKPVRRTVLVLLQNDANVRADVAAAAQAEVVGLFALANIEVEWVTKVPVPGIRLRVISLVTWEPPDEKMQSVRGLTYGNHRTRAIRG